MSELLAVPERSTQWLKAILPDKLAALGAWQPDSDSGTRHIDQPTFAKGIPGRKWQQINYFSDLIEPLEPLDTNLDWCSGKGYLATNLHDHYGLRESHCVDIDAALCASGRERALSFGLSTHFHCFDVLKPLPAELIELGERQTALHACGGLHRSMLSQASRSAQQIVLAPCCYHLFSDEESNCLSQAARDLPLVFNPKLLRLPLLETVTGGARVQRLRAIELTWRLAYEMWRQQQTGEEHYRPLSSTPKAIFNSEPEQFFEWAASQHGLQWEKVDLEPYLSLGKQRFLLSERLGIVRQGLKRFVEYAIVLDLGCYLEERGYKVRITEFCPRKVTPRNLAILAVKG